MNLPFILKWLCHAEENNGSYPSFSPSKYYVKTTLIKINKISFIVSSLLEDRVSKEKIFLKWTCWRICLSLWILYIFFFLRFLFSPSSLTKFYNYIKTNSSFSHFFLKYYLINFFAFTKKVNNWSVIEVSL